MVIEMKNRGFTLVEVIAVIAILGFLTLMTVPAITRLMASNDQKALEYYGKTLKNSAKACINAKECDPGIISCDELINKGFMKGTMVDGVEKCVIKNYECRELSVLVDETTKKTGKTYKYKYNFQCKRRGESEFHTYSQ